MSTSKSNIALWLLSIALLVSFLVLIGAYRGDKSWVRMALASFGFIGFAWLYVAVICEKFRFFKS